MKTNRLLLAVIAAIVLVSLVMGGFGCKAPATPTTPTTPTATTPTATTPAAKTLKLGFIFPLTGVFAHTGLTSLHGLQSWVENVNADGGVKIGTDTYMLDIVTYDDTGYVPSEVLKGVQKLALEDGVQYIHVTPTSAALDAIGQWALDHNVNITIHGASTGLRPEWPNVIGSNSYWPMCYASVYPYMAEQYPDIEKAAIILPDATWTVDDHAWQVSAARISGWELVADVTYQTGTVDWYPLVTSVLEKNPDVINLGPIPPGDAASILEAARTLGYEGRWTSLIWNVPVMTEKVPVEYVEGSYSALTTLQDGDIIGTDLQRLKQTFESHWPGEYIGETVPHVFGHSLSVSGMQATGSTDPEVVRNYLLSTDPYVHPLLGPGSWAGANFGWGDHWLVTPWFVGQIVNGQEKIVAKFDFPAWLKVHESEVISIMKEIGYLN